ncbi:hypothetical protein A8I34_23085, partial [Shigella sonnei]|nr:hypothetical protein [Shigella sonnei]EFZ7315879.1 hypothetical protein [Shigella sonnei]EGD8697356.1 hypothetical protein [Shigella sonnei]EGE4543799.1 hypothetical protein [Shigella sonnei]
LEPVNIIKFSFVVHNMYLVSICSARFIMKSHKLKCLIYQARSVIEKERTLLNKYLFCCKTRYKTAINAPFMTEDN